MAWYGRNRYPDYVSVAQRRTNAAKLVKRLRKKGETLSPVVIDGRSITRTFWGKAWCDNLESYRDYANRLGRGRSYVRHGQVIDLQMHPGQIISRVNGTSLYRITVTISALPAARWAEIKDRCTGEIDSVIDLLQGQLSKGVMSTLCAQRTGLFPSPDEISLSCSCPDGARMCKHVAATLYGVGARLDDEPTLLFRLRDVDEAELITSAAVDALVGESDDALGDDDLSALFGIDMESAEPLDILASLGSAPADSAPAAPALAGSASLLSASSLSAQPAPTPVVSTPTVSTPPFSALPVSAPPASTPAVSTPAGSASSEGSPTQPLGDLLVASLLAALLGATDWENAETVLRDRGLLAELSLNASDLSPLRRLVAHADPAGFPRFVRSWLASVGRCVDRRCRPGRRLRRGLKRGSTLPPIASAGHGLCFGADPGVPLLEALDLRGEILVGDTGAPIAELGRRWALAATDPTLTAELSLFFDDAIATNFEEVPHVTFADGPRRMWWTDWTDWLPTERSGLAGLARVDLPDRRFHLLSDLQMDAAEQVFTALCRAPPRGLALLSTQDGDFSLVRELVRGRRVKGETPRALLSALGL